MADFEVMDGGFPAEIDDAGDDVQAEGGNDDDIMDASGRRGAEGLTRLT